MHNTNREPGRSRVTILVIYKKPKIPKTVPCGTPDPDTNKSRAMSLYENSLRAVGKKLTDPCQGVPSNTIVL